MTPPAPARATRPASAPTGAPAACTAPPRNDGLLQGADGRVRCAWAGTDAQYLAYHDDEWGRPLHTDAAWFEKVSLEGFQSGLSWLTILRKRENFRRAFKGFEIDRVARFDEQDRARLLADAGIVRHRGKIDAVIGNAARARELREEFGSLARYFNDFRPDPGSRPDPVTWQRLLELAAQPPEQACRLSADLRRRGWRFIGPVTAYALMQSSGLVNDHVQGCCIRADCEPSRIEGAGG